MSTEYLVLDHMRHRENGVGMGVPISGSRSRAKASSPNESCFAWLPVAFFFSRILGEVTGIGLGTLDCYWVIFGNFGGFSTKPPKKVSLFAGGSLQQPSK